MALINCEINLILTWSDRCFIIDNPIDDQVPTFTITDTKLYVSVVTLKIQNNAKLLEQLKSGFKRTINWNKYEPKVTVEQQNQYLDFLINPSFQEVNRLFVLSFEDNTWYLIALDTDPKAIQQISFTANLGRAGNTTMLFITEEAKEQGTVTVLWMSSYNFILFKYNINIKWLNVTL